MAEVRADPRPAITHGDVIAAVAALLLLIFMFGTQWFGVAGIPGTSAHAQAVATENAWGSMSVIRWVMLLTILAAGAGVLIHLVRVSRGTVALIRTAVALLGSLTAVLLTYRVLINPPSPSDVVDQKLGAVLGLVCAYGIAVGGFESIREQRTRARSSIQVSRSEDPLVSSRARR